MARAKRAELYDYIAHLEFARRAKLRFGATTESIEVEQAWAYTEINRLNQVCGERIEPRRKLPKSILPTGEKRPEYHLFLDECGNHRVNPLRDPFPIFCLAGVIVPVDSYDDFDREWKNWKADHLGGDHVLVHEPDVRHRVKGFYRADPDEQAQLFHSLNSVLGRLEFTCIAAAIDKRAFADVYADGQVDDFLPSSAYLMCVDFVFERFVHFLHHSRDARGLTTAESRGPREDAEVHFEFLRLHLEGTQWQPQRQFRHALRPYMEFRRKNGNISGLEIADLVARPIAERILALNSTPIRWETVEQKLYDGGKSRKGSYGLKVFPTPNLERIFSENSD